MPVHTHTAWSYLPRSSAAYAFTIYPIAPPQMVHSESASRRVATQSACSHTSAHGPHGCPLWSTLPGSEITNHPIAHPFASGSFACRHPALSTLSIPHAFFRLAENTLFGSANRHSRYRQAGRKKILDSFSAYRAGSRFITLQPLGYPAHAQCVMRTLDVTQNTRVCLLLTPRSVNVCHTFVRCRVQHNPCRR